MKKVIYTIILLVIVSWHSYGQLATSLGGSSVVQGFVYDSDTNERLLFATICVYHSGVRVAVAETDLDGYYLIDGLEPGDYELKTYYLGYEEAVFSVSIGQSEVQARNLELVVQRNVIDGVEIIAYKSPHYGCVNWGCGSTVRADTLPEESEETENEASEIGTKLIPEINFRIYPNPAQHRATVDLLAIADRIVVYDALGKQVHAEKIFNPGPHLLHVHNYIAGSYYVAVFSEGSLLETKPLKVIN